MKFTSLLLLLILSISAYAQKKLKTTVYKETGDTLYYTSEEKIYNQPGGSRAVGEYLKTSIYKDRNGYRLCLSIQTGRTNVFTIAEGAAATIKLLDGTALTVYSTGLRSAKNSSMNYGSFIFSFYRLDRNSLQQLKSSGIASIQVQASLGTMDYIIKEKFSDAIQEQLQKFDADK